MALDVRTVAIALGIDAAVATACLFIFSLLRWGGPTAKFYTPSRFVARKDERRLLLGQHRQQKGSDNKQHQHQQQQQQQQQHQHQQQHQQQQQQHQQQHHHHHHHQPLQPEYRQRPRPPRLPRGPLQGVWRVWKLREEQVLHSAGLDVVVYLRLLRMGAC